MSGKPKVVYLDNNSTTAMCKQARDVHQRWNEKCENPSSSSRIAKPSKKLIADAKEYILNHCEVSDDPATGYTVLFTGGATESNAFILRSTVDAWLLNRKSRPHLIISAVEHSSMIKCAAALVKQGRATLTVIEPTVEGVVPVPAIVNAITDDTCLVSVMFANNETGAINSVKAIGRVCHDRNVPYHCDAVQGFGKYQIDLAKNNIDAMSASFHKLCGPRGLGLMIISNGLITGYGLEAQVNGSQQEGLRGGTENVPAIAAGMTALKCAFQNRLEKNTRLYTLKKSIVDKLGAIYPVGEYTKYVQRGNLEEVETAFDDDTMEGFTGDGVVELMREIRGGDNNASGFAPVEIVFLGPSVDEIHRSLPNTLLLAVAKNRLDAKGEFCNVKLRDALDRRGVVVSISSACNTESDKASHVLSAIRAPRVIKQGVIRVSMGDSTTAADIRQFIEAFQKAVAEQISPETTRADAHEHRAKKSTKAPSKAKTPSRSNKKK
jgi:cysteine desulfurase